MKMQRGFTLIRTLLRKNLVNVHGFTLIEMLVALSVLSVAGVLILNIFTRTLRGSNKSQIIGVMKQNGQSVLDNMDRVIKDAGSIVCPTITSPATSATSETLMLVNKGIYTRYRFIPLSDSANGSIKQDNPVKQFVEGSDPPREETDKELIDRVCNSNNRLINEIVLTDTKADTGVSIENGSFKRERFSGFKDQVTIQFIIKPGKDALKAVTGQIDDVSFQTTIQLR